MCITWWVDMTVRRSINLVASTMRKFLDGCLASSRLRSFCCRVPRFRMHSTPDSSLVLMPTVEGLRARVANSNALRPGVGQVNIR